VDHAQHRPDWKLAPDLEPRVDLLPGPAVHPDLTALAAFPAADKDGAAGAVQIALLMRESFADPQACSPEQHDERAEAVAVWAITDASHDRDDLFNRRRVGRVLLALVARRAASVIARHGRRGAAVAGGVQEHGFHESSLGGG
jgi:hypothetical protein